MTRGIRVVNVVLAILFALIGITLIIRAPESHTTDVAYRVGQVIGTSVVLAPLITVFYLTWRALSANSTVGAVKTARIANIIATVVTILFFSAVAVFASTSFSIRHLLVILIFALPFMLNVMVLGKKRAEFDRATGTPKSEPAPASETIGTGEISDRANVPRHVPAPAVSAEPVAVSQGKKTSSNYFVRHWRGELSLGISYWVNGSILAGIVPIALIGALAPMVKDSHSLRWMSFLILSFMLFSVIAWFWSIVGIWRSAGQHVARGGKAGWANAAKAMVVLGLVAMAARLATNIVPQVKEFALIAIGNDPIGSIKINVATNGLSVIIVGALREGSAAEIRKILDAAPGAKTLVLNSNGGRLLEARQIARIVQNRHLDTYVEDQCVSACTYVFLAGRERAATPNARIGFHQPSFPGYDAVAERSATQEMLDVYRTAGLPEAFVQRIGRTPPEDMWYPSRDELIDAHVITRVSLGGEIATSGLWLHSKQEFMLQMKSIPLYQAIEKRFPGTINEAVERGWAVKERGGSDADIMNAMRNVNAELYPKLLKTADTAVLESYIKLMVDELLAARAVSGEACARLLASQLDITKTLPKELGEREQQFLMQALATPPRTEMELPDAAQVRQAMQSVAAGMPQGYINVIANTKSYSDRPELVCGAMIAFYQGIEALPPRERVVALQGLFQR